MPYINPWRKLISHIQYGNPNGREGRRISFWRHRPDIRPTSRAEQLASGVSTIAYLVKFRHISGLKLKRRLVRKHCVPKGRTAYLLTVKTMT